MTGNTKLRDDLTGRLLALKLSPQQLQCIAAAFGRTSAKPADSDGTGHRFWQHVLNASEQGSDIWLEASLQSALLEFENGNAAEATRRLAVVDLLHPDWGGKERQQRAEELARRLAADQ
ncbi:MAG: hypothetical protein R3C19_02130 [Planctomycetaceae bacterium]